MFTNKVVCLSLLLVFITISLTFADPVTKVLQNGKDGYEGCKDSYTYSFNPDDNYSTIENLFNHNCQN